LRWNKRRRCIAPVVQLEKFRDRHALAADVAVARAAHAVRAAEGPDQFDRRIYAVQFGAHDKTFGGRERQHRQIQFAVAEQRVADGIKQRAGAIARDDLLRVVQPFHAGGSLDAETKIAAASGQVE
jgi:hypothetical protein